MYPSINDVISVGESLGMNRSNNTLNDAFYYKRFHMGIKGPSNMPPKMQFKAGKNARPCQGVGGMKILVGSSGRGRVLT
jgi:hypothetical protein